MKTNLSFVKSEIKIVNPQSKSKEVQYKDEKQLYLLLLLLSTAVLHNKTSGY
jgi:hypothetical protein